MYKKYLAGLIGCIFSCSVSATETIALEKIVTTANRIPQISSSVLSDISVIDQKAIERAGSDSLADLLRTQPGIQINTSGGAGKVSEIFIRGTNANHVVVVVDGMRLNSATLGTTAFENIPLAQIEKIEILRGPASSLYGADAIGGVIHIFTRQASGNKPTLHAAVGMGSYNTKTAEVGMSHGINDTRYSIHINGSDTDGFSAKRTNTAPDSDKDGYHNLALSTHIKHSFTTDHTLELQYFASKGRSYSDSGYADNLSHQTLQSYALVSENQLHDLWHSTLKLGQGMDESDNHSSSSVSLFKTKQNQFTWQNDISIPVGILTLAYDRLEQTVSGSTNYTVKTRDNNAYLISYVADKDQHHLQASWRQDRNSQFGQTTTGGAGYGYDLTPAWRVSANYGTAFKTPTFNQLYYPSFGDATLRPEESKNKELAIHYTTAQQHASFTVFNNKISDLIELSGPATAGCTYAGYCPVNVATAEIQGATFAGDWILNDHWSLAGHFTVQSPRNEATDTWLIRRGQRYGALNLQHTWNGWHWGAEISGSSTRYNNASNSQRMPGYLLLNLTAQYQYTPEWSLEARANNVLDKDYVLSYASYPSTPYNTADANLFVNLRYNMQP